MTFPYTEEQIEAAAKEIEEMENEEWRALVAGMFFKPLKRSASNRKKKRNLQRTR